MKFRTAMLVAIVLLAGCRGGAATVPPPGTGSYQAPNNYYQPPAGAPTYTPPTYGAPGAAPIAPPPGFSSTAPNANFTLASSNPSTGGNLNWQPVTKPPAIGRSTATTINPQTTLTTIRGTNAPVSPAPITRIASSTGLRDISELPVVPIAGAPPPTTNPFRTTVPAAAPTYTVPPSYAVPPAYSAPLFTPAPTGAPRTVSDPWRGR